MVYDAATGQVMLFSGFGSSSYVNDTWTWNGTAWAQQSPSSSPPARYAAPMVYDPATGQVVLFSGDGSSGILSDTWTWSGTTWVQQSPSTSPPARYAASMAYLAAPGQVVLFGGAGSGGSYLNDTWVLQIGSVNLGTANVCSSGAPTPCSKSATLTFTFSGTSGTIKAPAVLTQGAAGLDFTDAGTGTCTTNGTSHTYSSGNTCTVVVTFAPKFPGQRMGAVELLNSSGTVIATTYVSGTGTGPLLALTSGVETTPYTGLSNPQSMAFDGAGNLYVTNYGANSVVKYPAGSTTATTFLSSQSKPFGIAVDGAGNVFVAKYGSTNLTEVTAAGVQTTFGSGLNEPQGLAIDGAGTIYVENSGVPNVVKFVNGSTTPTVVATLPTQFGRNIVVDGSGNLFVADSSSGILEIAAGSSTATAFATPGVNLPSLGGELGVAVDAAGNVYATPESTLNTQVYEIPASGANAFLIGTSSNTNGIALDASGRLYLATYGGTINLIDRTQAAPLTFANTVDGAISAAQTVVLENDGNTTLNFAIPGSGVTNPTSPTDFTFASSTSGACPSLTSSATTQGTLAAGSSCTVPITFTPVAPSNGTLTESLIFTDNSLNAPSAAQTITVSGVATDPAPTITSISPNHGPIAGGTVVTITGTNFTGTQNVYFLQCAGNSTASFTVVNSTTITATSTADGMGSACTAQVSLATPGGTSNAVNFYYYDAAFTSLSVSGYSSPAIITEGSTVTLSALDQNSNVYTAFTGTVTLSSATDTKATLPAAYTFQSSDAGVHNFSATLNTRGSQTLTATSGSVSGSQTGILVGDAVWVLGGSKLVKLYSQGGTEQNNISTTDSAVAGGIAFDNAGVVWSVGQDYSLVCRSNVSGTVDSCSGGGGINGPAAVAVDGAGYVWVANATGNTVSEFNNSASPLSPSQGFGSSYVTGEAFSAPSAIVIDRTGGVWVANKTGNSVTHIFGAAKPVVTPLSTSTTNGTLGTQP